MKIAKSPIALALIAAMIIAVTWFSISTNGAKPGALFFPDNAKIVAQGQKLYGENCASCHGENLEGQANWQRPGKDGLLPAPPHDESGHSWHHSDELLFGITKIGVVKFSGLDNYKTNMPVYEDILSDAEIIAVWSFIKSQWPTKMQKRHDEMNALN